MTIIGHSGHLTELGKLLCYLINRMLFRESHHIPQMKSFRPYRILGSGIDRENPFYLIAIYKIQYFIHTQYSRTRKCIATGLCNNPGCLKHIAYPCIKTHKELALDHIFLNRH